MLARTRIGIHANVNEYRWQECALREASLGLPEFAFGAGPARFAFKTSGSIKQSTSHERQLTFVPYDERAAEYDLIRLARLLARGLQRRHPWWRFLRSPERISLKIVFVLDELDKWKTTDRGWAAISRRPLQLAQEPFHYLGHLFRFRGGKRSSGALARRHRPWRQHLRKRFCWECYLPILWEDEGSIFRNFLSVMNERQWR